MSISFQDEWSRWHVKPCYDGKYSSNNGWIQSAYCEMAGLTVSRTKLYECHLASRKNRQRSVPVHRHPDKFLPPMSRDEILGMAFFNNLRIGELQQNHWQFCDLDGAEAKPLYKVNWLAALRDLMKIGLAQLVIFCWYGDELRSEAPEWLQRWSHRNIVWELPSLYQISYRLMPQDTWYLLKRAGRKTTWLHDKYAWWSMERTVKKDDTSGVLMVWMKLYSLGLTHHPLYRKIDYKKHLTNYFKDTRHPIHRCLEV